MGLCDCEGDANQVILGLEQEMIGRIVKCIERKRRYCGGFMSTILQMTGKFVRSQVGLE
jgi:hypothetical protein